METMSRFVVCACVLMLIPDTLAKHHKSRTKTLAKTHNPTKKALNAAMVNAMNRATAEFKVDWCRQRISRYDWKLRLKSCLDKIQWESTPTSPSLETDPRYSYVFLDIRPAGYYSKVIIQTVSKTSQKKTVGGDFFRVYIQGPSNLTADVIDRNDGTYEAIFLVMVPGIYEITVILDYTMCKGIKDPPFDWFTRGCLHGSFQSLYSLHDRVYDYLNIPLQAANSLEFQVKPSYALYDKELTSFKDAGHLGCRDQCNVLWDGYGTWEGEEWEPYSPGVALANSGHIQGQGVLWVYGDSLNRYFFESISGRRLCWQVFRACYFTMTWVYILRSTAQVEMDLRYGHKYINVPRILNELKSVITRPEMDENSALLLNAGVHLLKSSGFYTYQKVINGMVMVLKRFYRGTVVWKTTTSIGEQKQMYSGCFRRFHTEQRIDLFNAYAMAAMCRAGFLILDVYPLTSSYSGGTVDGVHYNRSVFVPAEQILEDYFST